MRRISAILVIAMALASCVGGKSTDELAFEASLDIRNALARSEVPDYRLTQTEFQGGVDEEIFFVVQFSSFEEQLDAATPRAVLFDVPLGVLGTALDANPQILDEADVFIVAFQDSCQTVYELSEAGALSVASGTTRPDELGDDLEVTSLC